MGYGPNLLYWGEILKRYLKSCPNSIFFSTGERRLIPGTSHYIESKINHLPRIGFLKNRIVALPNFLITLFREQPDLVVISEFGVISIYVCLARRHLPKAKILLLVESDSTRGGTKYSGPIRTRIRKFICRKADLILTNNNAGYTYLTQKLDVHPDKIEKAVYLTSELHPQRTNNPSNFSQQKNHKLNFLFVGRLIEWKGLHLLINAVAQIDQNRRERLRITIAGEGPKKTTLLQQIQKQNLNNCFNLVGSIPYKKLAVLYCNADAFILPTIYDYRALVGFEAISAGLPLLHSQWDGAAQEIKKKKKNGYIIDPYDTNHFASKIAWFIDNRDKLDLFREKSKKIALNFTFDRAADNLVEACARCLCGVS
jgi:glycosyltransferase involved in cell wall biosynthesis